MIRKKRRPPRRHLPPSLYHTTTSNSSCVDTTKNKIHINRRGSVDIVFGRNQDEESGVYGDQVDERVVALDYPVSTEQGKRVDNRRGSVDIVSGKDKNGFYDDKVASSSRSQQGQRIENRIYNNHNEIEERQRQKRFHSTELQRLRPEKSNRLPRKVVERRVEEVSSLPSFSVASSYYNERKETKTVTLTSPSQILSKWLSDLRLLSDKGLDPTERVDTMVVIKTILEEEGSSIPDSLKSKLMQTCTDDLLLRTKYLDRDLRFGLVLVQILQLLGPRYSIKALPMLKVWLLRLTKNPPVPSERKQIDRVVTEILRTMFLSGMTGILETLALIKVGRSRTDAIILTFALQHLPELRSEILGPLFSDTLRRTHSNESVHAIGYLMHISGEKCLEMLVSMVNQNELGRARERTRMIAAWTLHISGHDNVLLRIVRENDHAQIRKLVCMVLAMPRLDKQINCARFVVIPSENVGDEEFRFVVMSNSKKKTSNQDDEEEDQETSARIRILRDMAGDVKPFWEPSVVRKTIVEVSSEEVATRLRRIVVEERGLDRIVRRSSIMSSNKIVVNQQKHHHDDDDECFSTLASVSMYDPDFSVRTAAIACISTLSCEVLQRHEHVETFVSNMLRILDQSPPLVLEHPSHEDRYLNNPSASHSEKREKHGDLRESCVAALGSPSLINAISSTGRESLALRIVESLTSALSDPMFKTRYSSVVSLSSWYECCSSFVHTFREHTLKDLIRGLESGHLPHDITPLALVSFGLHGVNALTRIAVSNAASSTVRVSCVIAMRRVDVVNDNSIDPSELVRVLQRLAKNEVTCARVCIFSLLFSYLIRRTYCMISKTRYAPRP